MIEILAPNQKHRDQKFSYPSVEPFINLIMFIITNEEREILLKIQTMKLDYPI